jgi:hypothetical protein
MSCVTIRILRHVERNSRYSLKNFPYMMLKRKKSLFNSSIYKTRTNSLCGETQNIIMSLQVVRADVITGEKRKTVMTDS